MFEFTNITPTNGFDTNNLDNARQNNYAWSMSELDDYIYVGTGRNILVVILKSYFPNINLPISIDPLVQENNAEIWRYKKGESTKPWERVYIAPAAREYGFRFMVNFRPFNGNPALYASTAVTSGDLNVYKSVNGVDWKAVLTDVEGGGNIQGTSSRAMIVHRGKLYMATINDSQKPQNPTLYSSEDPEFYPWKLETPSGFDPSKNPQGAITNMIVFNNRIYVATSTSTGVQVWRTNGYEPEVDEWTLVVKDGFGNPDNKYSLSIGVFKNHLYVSGTKELPLAWIIPRGCDIVRINKYDKWDIVVGPYSKSDIWSGFNNPFNVYAWQIQEYNNRLLITTFDDATNMQLILEILLANKDNIGLPDIIVNILIEIYKLVVELLNRFKYPFGFSLYASDDGIQFYKVFVDGLNDRYNYGGRILFVDSEKDLYIGTANPYQGLEVWKAEECCYSKRLECKDECNYNKLLQEITQHYSKLDDHMEELTKCIPHMKNRYDLKK